MSPRRDGTPVLVKASGQVVQSLARLPLNERDIDEAWLQRLLHEHPEILPIDEIDPGFGPVFSVGREIATSVGPIDNLYVSPQGLLTIVEAKLWKNPEARRQVIGQILDYAKEVSRWSFEELDARAKANGGKTLWELVKSGQPDGVDEARFIDSVVRHMRDGRFLLLIVGDGIREELERLADFLQATPQLRFTLALVELQIYRLESNGDLVIMPMVVGRTTEVTRAVVQVRSSDQADVGVEITLSDESGGGSPTARSILTYEDFFQDLTRAKATRSDVETAQRLYEDFSRDERFFVDWKSASFTIKLRDPSQASAPFTVLVVTRDATAYTGWLDGQLTRAGLDPSLALDFARETGEILGLRVHSKHLGSWERAARLAELGEHYAPIKARIDKLAEDVLAARTIPGE